MNNVFVYRDGESDGGVFILRRSDGEEAEQAQNLNEEFLRYHSRSFYSHTVSKILIFVMIILAVSLGVFIVVNPMLGIELSRSEEIWITVGGLFGIVAIAVIVSVVSVFIEKRKRKSKKYKNFEEKRASFDNELRARLGVPDDSLKFDVFSYRYNTKNNKLIRNPLRNDTYMTYETVGWREGEAMFFYDRSAVFRFPLADLVRIVRVDEKLVFWGWSKKEKINGEKYKPYKIGFTFSFDNNKKAEGYHVKAYYRLVFARDGEEYEILIPNYEKETLEKLTGKTLP